MVFLTLLWSCHNEDFAKGETESQRNNANFFKHVTSNTAKSGVDYVSILEAYNREKDFLTTMPDQKGMPIWDKMQVLDIGEKTVLYVPLSEDKTDLSSLMVVKLDEENSVFHLQNFTNDYLEAYVYNTDYPKEQRKLLMDTFLQMDFFTFGHQEFTNLPKDLYKGSTEYSRLNIFDEKKETVQNKGFIYTTICIQSHYCVHGQSVSTCDYSHCTCGGSLTCSLTTSCTTTSTWVDDPIGSGFPSGGVFSGGGSGTPVDHPKDPCTQAKVFYRVTPQCVGNNGNVETPNLDTPCAKIKSVVNNAQLKPKIDSLKQYSLTAVENEKGYQQDKSGNVTPALVNGAHHVDFLIDQNSLGGIHCHTLNGTHMFTPPDILTLIRFARVQNYTLPIGSIADNTGNGFLGMIAQSGSYFITFNGGSGDLPPPMTQADEEAFEIEMNDAYKDILEKLLKAEHKSSWDTLSQQGLQKLFFNIIKKMGLEGKINLIKQDSNNISTIQQNSDGTIKEPIPC